MSDKLWRASLSMLAAAVGLYVAWEILRPMLPALIVLVALLFVYRMAFGLFRSRRGW